MKNVSGEIMSCNDIFNNLIKQFEFCFKRCLPFAQCLYEDYYFRVNLLMLDFLLQKNLESHF